jgi:hypothetical protein
MITLVQPLYIGNALRLFLEPPPGAVLWRVLRKGSDSFTDVNDSSAFVAYEGDSKVIVDSSYLVNGVMAFYRAFYTADGVNWTASQTVYGTPTASLVDYTPDVLSVVRDRLEAGLKVEVEQGNLQNELGYIQVYTAPPSMEQTMLYPLVTVTLDDENSEMRGIGEQVISDEFDAIGDDWDDSDGWISPFNMTIVGWSLNSDERLALRKAIRRIIVGNLSVFAANGMDQVTLQLNNMDYLGGEFGAPMYTVTGQLSCNAMVRVGGTAPKNTDFTLRGEAYG